MKGLIELCSLPHLYILGVMYFVSSGVKGLLSSVMPELGNCVGAVEENGVSTES